MNCLCSVFSITRPPPLKKKYVIFKMKWICSAFLNHYTLKDLLSNLSPLSFTMHQSDLMKNHISLRLMIKRVTHDFF